MAILDRRQSTVELLRHRPRFPGTDQVAVVMSGNVTDRRHHGGRAAPEDLRDIPAFYVGEYLVDCQPALLDLVAQRRCQFQQ